MRLLTKLFKKHGKELLAIGFLFIISVIETEQIVCSSKDPRCIPKNPVLDSVLEFNDAV